MRWSTTAPNANRTWRKPRLRLARSRRQSPARFSNTSLNPLALPSFAGGLLNAGRRICVGVDNAANRPQVSLNCPSNDKIGASRSATDIAKSGSNENELFVASTMYGWSDTVDACLGFVRRSAGMVSRTVFGSSHERSSHHRRLGFRQRSDWRRCLFFLLLSSNLPFKFSRNECPLDLSAGALQPEHRLRGRGQRRTHYSLWRHGRHQLHEHSDRL